MEIKLGKIYRWSTIADMYDSYHIVEAVAMHERSVSVRILETHNRGSQWAYPKGSVHYAGKEFLFEEPIDINNLMKDLLK